MYEILPSLMKHVSERHKKVFSAYEFMRSFIKKEIESHKKSNRAQDPKDFIDFYLAQINKVSACCVICDFRSGLHNLWSTRLNAAQQVREKSRSLAQAWHAEDSTVHLQHLELKVLSWMAMVKTRCMQKQLASDSPLI